MCLQSKEILKFGGQNYEVNCNLCSRYILDDGRCTLDSERTHILHHCRAGIWICTLQVGQYEVWPQVLEGMAQSEPFNRENL